MQRTEAQHKETHNPPAQRQGCGKALESPQREQIAQLDVVVESSPQGGKMAQLASMANASPQVAAQRRLMDMIQNSPRMAAQRKAIDAIHTSPHVTAQRQQLDSFTAKPAQLQETEEETLQPKVAQREEAPAKPNNTGLPDNLKHGIESLSGLSMDNVKVHYNSSQPAQLNALAYAQGTDIHVAPGQEKHLPHEAWHVVQQAQGRVQPTTQMKSGVPINDDAGLEREADVMGGRAVSVGVAQEKSMESAHVGAFSHPIQCMNSAHSTTPSASSQSSIPNAVTLLNTWTAKTQKNPGGAAGGDKITVNNCRAICIAVANIPNLGSDYSVYINDSSHPLFGDYQLKIAFHQKDKSGGKDPTFHIEGDMRGLKMAYKELNNLNVKVIAPSKFQKQR